MTIRAAENGVFEVGAVKGDVLRDAVYDDAVAAGGDSRAEPPVNQTRTLSGDCETRARKGRDRALGEADRQAQRVPREPLSGSIWPFPASSARWGVNRKGPEFVVERYGSPPWTRFELSSHKTGRGGTNETPCV